MKPMFFIIWSLLTLLVVYAAGRGWMVWRDFPMGRMAWVVAVAVLYMLLTMGTFWGVSGSSTMSRAIAFAGHSALVFFIYLFLLFLLIDVLCLGSRVTKLAPEGLPVFRRWTLGVGLVVIVVAMVAGNWRFNHPVVMRMELQLDRPPTQERELTLVVASDIHLGNTITKKRLQHYVQLINDQHPDVVLMVGDVCDHSLAPIVRQRMTDDLRLIEAPLGVYAVPGNHEYIGGDIEGKIAYLASGGIRFLRDSVVTLADESLYVLGRDDRTNKGRKPLADLLAPLDRSKPVVVLDHQPFDLQDAEACGVDLQLSGHTHNGQFFPLNLLMHLLYEKAYGYLRRGQTQYYISSGLGLWGPQYRIGTQSELIVIRLTY